MKNLDLANLAEVREFGHIEFLAKQLVEGFITGLHRSPFHGFSVEFAEHRLYNTGESTRHIDWKVYAKTDRLYTKRYEEETNLRCQLLLDVSRNMYYRNKLKFAIIASSAIAFMLQKQKDAVSLCTFAHEVKVHTPTKSTPSHLNKLFIHLDAEWQELLAQQDKEPTDIEKKMYLEHAEPVTKVLHEIADKIPRRSLLIIFSDMFERVIETEGSNGYDSIFSALQHLKHNQHEVLLFSLLHKDTEYDFNFPARPTIFVDIETGERLKVDNPEDLKQTLLARKKAFYDELKLRCGQYKIDLIETEMPEGFGYIDVEQKVGEVLRAYLVKRERMK